MSILVRLVDGTWQEWHGKGIATQMVSTYTALYGDGRQIETPCDPYPVEIQMNGDSLLGFYDQGIWTLDEVHAVGGEIALPFPVPEGKQTVGLPSYEEDGGVVQQVYEVEDIPAAPEPPTAAEKVAGMLSGWDLSLADLKTVLGLSA
jgi:hypothetical protein